MSDNHSPTVTNSSTSSDRSASSNSFWSHIIRPQVSIRPPTTIVPTSVSSSSTPNSAHIASTSTDNNNFNQTEKFTQRLNDLKSSESIQTRLKLFDELIKLSEVSILNESLINNLLESTRDLYLIEKTPFEFRKQAFENLTHIYQKQSEKFESLINKNHLLIILIANLTNLNPNDSLFLSVFEPMLKNIQTKPLENLPPVCDDIKQRFALFTHLTKNGTCCKNLDQKLANECLQIFLQYSTGLEIKLFYDLFKNLLQNKYFSLFDDNLISLLSKHILNYSYNLLKQTDNLTQLNKNQSLELKSCIDLCEKLTPNLVTIESVSHMIIVLCELIAFNVQKNSTDTQQIYECMSSLLTSAIGHSSLFSFFTQIFPSHGKLQTFRLQQVNGALLHIKQLFEDFKQTKLKNTFLIKEMHLNCLVYLPTALKSCCTDHQTQHLILFENILSLTLDLVQLATHRDLFMCLLTFNSRKFLIEIIEQFSTQINQTENKKLIQPYADLLNLLDKKDVFNYKTSQTGLSSSTNTSNSSSANTTSTSVDDGNTIVLQKFKENFHTLVFNFPHISYLTDTCINNCIDYHLQRKLLPVHGKHSVQGIKLLIEKYFHVKSNKHIKLEIRKNILELVCKKLFEYNRNEYKTFIDDVIQKAILPCIEQSIIEDNVYYNSHNNDVVLSAQMHSELIEIKSFTINKLIELSTLCHYEDNILKLIDIFQQIIHLEKTNSIEQLNIQNSAISTTPITNRSPAILSPIIPSINSQNYLNRIINTLIDLFERHHYNSSHCMTRSCVRIYSILTNYLDGYYDSFCNKPSSLSTIAADTLAFQQQQQHQQLQHRNSISMNTDQNLKYFNYYAQLRRDVFDFLFRLRSDSNNRVQLLNRNDRKKHIDSKYLMLVLNKSIDYNEDYSNKCILDYGKFLDVILECLDKESDWNVLIKVLNELPLVLQFEMGLIKNSEFIHNIFNYLHKREINSFKNRPDTLTRPDYMCKFYPLISSLILYHPLLERSSQEIILQNFALGISSSRSRFCLETLTIAITEMHETNAKQCADILLKLSQFSPSQNMAQPVLELLSTISDLKKLDSTIFGRKEFIAVSATAIKYTDPLKFNPFIILLAHYVICIWFIKCKQDFRKNYASFTCKGLYQEVIVQLDRLNQTISTKKDSKSPNRQLTETESVIAMKQRSATVSTMSTPNLNLADDLNKSLQSKTTGLTENMKTFYRELVEITLDFMSNNMFFDNTQQMKYNNNGMLVDMYSNASLTASNNSTLRNNSLIDGASASALTSTNSTSTGFGNRNNCQSRSWICGNKIIQIKTGLFSNICVEEPNSNVSRRQRISASSSNKKTSTITPGSSQTSTNSKLASSLAINIPNQQFNKNTETKKANLASNQTANDSFASSESSTNNSFNLNKQLGDRDDLVITRKSSLLTATDSDHGKQGDEASLSAKSDQEYFEEAIEASNTNLPRDMQVNLDDETTLMADSNPIESTITRSNFGASSSSSRRTNLMKRRYKSGIPLSSNERSDDDILDEICLKNLNELSFNKQSKDDSDLSLASSLCCIKNNSSVDEMKQTVDTNDPNQLQIAQRSNQRTHQRNKTYSDSSDKRVTNDQIDSASTKEMCLPTCWCNNLVEVTCRYPTKVVTYIALIDGNNCTSHELNLSLIELQKQQQQTLKNIINASQIKVPDSNANTNETNLSEMPAIITPSMIANAVELRRNLSLSRISESSVSQQELSSANSNNSLESTNKDDEALPFQQTLKTNQSSLVKTAVLNQTAAIHNTTTNLNKSFYENDFIYQRPALMRKSSFDSSAPISNNVIAAAAARIPFHDLSASASSSANVTITNRRQPLQSPNTNEPNSSSPNNNSSLTQSTFNSTNTSINLPSTKQSITPATVNASIDPSQVFLHLFQQTTQPYSTTASSQSNNNDKEQPMMIPENPALQRSMNILDYLPCYLIHKIGVVYIGRNQANDEKAILSNACGSQRYKNFINGLGHLMRLKDLDTNRYYSGGLETDGSAGEFTLIWFDGIIQVVFHVATMMPLREENCNSKKKHIGNDATLIVFNESGEEYQFSMIKGEVNCVCIEIEPLATSNTNLIRVKTTSELAQSSWIIHQEQKFVSDQNLSIVARKIALHADIASRCYRFQKDNNGNNPYGGKWYERLKQINRIRKSCKEFYAKQQPIKSGSNTTTTTNTSSNTNTTTPSNLGTGTTATIGQIHTNNTDVPFDFTEYI